VYFSLEGTFFKFKVGNDFEVILNNGYNFVTIHLEDKEIFKEFKKLIPLLCISRHFLDKYEVLGQIGEGAFAKVCKVKSKITGKFFAAKIFTKN
jgi:hypothetical protein